MENSFQEDQDELEGKVDNAEKENLPIGEFKPNVEDEATTNSQEHLVDIEEDTKVAIYILPLSKKDEPCDTLQLPNGKVPQLEETTPNKTGVKVELKVDSKQAKDLKLKVSNKGI